jgi:hypothetical protein
MIVPQRLQESITDALGNKKIPVQNNGELHRAEEKK